MVRNREIVGRVTKMVIDKTLSPNTAAELLETSVRTIANYRKRYALHGAPGLADRRHGTFRKITPQTEQQIVECKLQKPHRSARWIRQWLRLDMSVETVRQVLVKHHLNGEAIYGNRTNGSEPAQLRRPA